MNTEERLQQLEAFSDHQAAQLLALQTLCRAMLPMIDIKPSEALALLTTARDSLSESFEEMNLPEDAKADAIRNFDTLTKDVIYANRPDTSPS